MLKPVLSRLVRASAMIAGVSLSLSAVAADGPPGSDIYLADLEKNTLGFYVAKNFSQLTERKGYDNQPYFLPDGSGILYTAMLPMDNGEYQADSFEYSFKTKQHTNLTQSELSEYSPMLMLGGRAFSTIVVERDGKQRLWGHPFHRKGKSYKLLDVEPVGYHAWGKKGALAMFVLGEPNTLQYKENFRAELLAVAKDIGRSIRYVASRNNFSFTELKEDGQWWLSEFNVDTVKIDKLVPMPKETGYYTWIDDTTAVTAIGTMLYTWRYDNKAEQTVKNWQKWVDASSVCKTKISRLAVNSDQSKLAFVCDE